MTYNGSNYQVLWLLTGNYDYCAQVKDRNPATSDQFFWDADISWEAHTRYVATPGDPTYSKGTLVGTVSSYNPDAYPNGGVSGKYYYELS